ncbi:hypothetical protein [Halobellus ruber]|uniref:Uncharacterized protein n=1 Tax=Halobellus ruber TaxID=2761102 RepID=A0A7J9SHM9_9EURY|nr:hypothetical protein [Halobellus ruber]MBB6646218.1 hypothetical protein [Halobellus ruber]
MVNDSDLRRAAETAEDLPDPHSIVGRDEEIPLGEIFDDAFIGEHTDFDTFDEMVAASPSDAADADELGKVGDDEWDAFVAETTVFEDEEEFVFAARDHWVAAQLGLD